MNCVRVFEKLLLNRAVIEKKGMVGTSWKMPCQTQITGSARKDQRKRQILWTPEQYYRVYIQELNAQEDEYCNNPVRGNGPGYLKLLLFNDVGPYGPGDLLVLKQCILLSKSDPVNYPRSERKSHKLSNTYSVTIFWSASTARVFTEHNSECKNVKSQVGLEGDAVQVNPVVTPGRAQTRRHTC